MVFGYACLSFSGKESMPRDLTPFILLFCIFVFSIIILYLGKDSGVVYLTFSMVTLLRHYPFDRSLFCSVRLQITLPYRYEWGGKNKRKMAELLYNRNPSLWFVHISKSKQRWQIRARNYYGKLWLVSWFQRLMFGNSLFNNFNNVKCV